MFLAPDPTPPLPSRKLLRLQNHDYSQSGPYFVTIGTHQKRCLLGSVNDSQVTLSPAGHIARQTWQDLPNRFPTLILDVFAVMPNHLHGILAFVGAGLAPPGLSDGDQSAAGQTKKVSLSDVICAFKSISTLRVNRLSRRYGARLWQRCYYEHIVRKGEDMKNVQRYILENPMTWELDSENSKASYPPSVSSAQL